MMKFNGKLIILLVFLLVVVSIGAVSATDDVAAIAADDSASIQNTQINEVSNDASLADNDGQPILNGSDLEKYYKGDENYIITLTDDNNTPLGGQIVQVTINGVTYNQTTNANGIISLPIGLSPGVYTIESHYNGEYGNASLINNITVKSTIIGNDLDLYYRNGSSYVVTVLNKNGNPLIRGSVEMNINGILYTRSVVDGIATLPIGLSAGTYVITTKSGYNGELISNNITVKPTIFGTDTSLYYRNGSGYVANVVDDQGSPVQTGSVEMNINGVIYNVVVVNGIASLPIGLSAGSYTITAKNMANGESTSNKVTILPTISGTDTTVYYRNGSGYVANVVDGQGSPVQTGSVEMNINGVIYNVAVVNGTASLPIGLSAGSYTITAKNMANGESTSNKVTVKSTISAEDGVFCYGSGESYEVTILDGQGNLSESGAVEMSINGGTYNCTVVNGTAALPITCAPGSYAITIKNLANGETTSKTITVVTGSIVGKDVTVYYRTGTKYTVYVFDNEGKRLDNVTVYFKVNGAIYNVTAEKGVASLPIGLDKGEYDITAFNPITGDRVTNHLTVVSSIFANDVVMSYGDGSTWDILILNANGEPNAGGQVSIYAGQTITMSTAGADGIYHYKINLPAGYIYTVQAFNGSIFSSSTVDSVVCRIWVYP